MGSFERYLEDSSARNLQQNRLWAADFMRHGVQSMIAEGQDPHEVYHRAIPIFGEEFLIEAGIVEIVNGEEPNNG